MRIIALCFLLIFCSAISQATNAEPLIQTLTRIEAGLNSEVEQALQCRDFIHGLKIEVSENPSFLDLVRYELISAQALNLLAAVNSEISDFETIKAQAALDEIENALSDTQPRQPAAGYEIRLDKMVADNRDVRIYFPGHGFERIDKCSRFNEESGNIIAACLRSDDPVFIHIRGTESVRERLEGRIALGPDSTARAVLFASPLFWEADKETKQQALQEMRSYEEYSVLVNLIAASANAGGLPLDPSQETVYRKAGEIAERFFDSLDLQSEKRARGSVEFEKTGSDQGSFSNDTFIYYTAKSSDGKPIFKEGNPFSRDWMFLTGKFKWFKWTSVSDVVENLWNWDLSLTSKPVVSDTVFENNAGSGTIIVEKDIPFNSVKAALVLIDVVAQIDICKRISEKKDAVYKIHRAASKVINAQAFKKVCAVLRDPEISAETKLKAITDFMYAAGTGTMSYVLKEFLKVVCNEIVSEALEEFLKGGLLERIFKDLLTGWVSYSVKIANETVPFLYDIAAGQAQYSFEY
ncbi:MAG: hypothetical protein PHQ23_10715 [Candidatus Wallbacteria bacterium]|nr:hypothetical protein [Candidatus Wallbacteria bacterium]